jgi:hypothetical protein
VIIKTAWEKDSGKNRKTVNNEIMSHLYRKKTQWNTLKTIEQHRIGRGSAVEEGRFQQLKHSTCTGVIPKQNSHWTTNRHLNNEGQEWKTGHIKGQALMGGGGLKMGAKKVNMVNVLSIYDI